MGDYYPLLKRAVAVLPNATPQTRRAIYERARKALLGQLRAMQPPVPEPDIERESTALDAAIAQLEAEFGAPVDPPPPVAAPPPPVAAPPPTAAPPPVQTAPPAPPQVPAAPKPAPSAAPAPVAAPPPPAKPGAAPPAAPKPAVAPPAAASPVATQPAAAPPKAPVVRPAAPRVAAPAAAGAKAAADKPVPAKPTPTKPAPAGPAPAAKAPQVAPPPPPQPESFDPDETLGLTPEASPELRVRPARPAAPQPPVERASNLRYVVVALALFAVLGAIAYAAWMLRDRPEDLAKARPEATTAQPAPDSGAKIVERVGGGSSQPAADSAPVPTVKAPTTAIRPTPAPGASGTPAAGPTPAAPGVAVAQRAALLVENRDKTQPPEVLTGTTVWKADKGALRAEIEVPDARLKASMTLQKNADLTLAASHTMDVRLDFSGGDMSIGRIGAPEMRREDMPNGDRLAAVAVPIASGYWLVGLARGEKDVAYNLDLLKTRGWIDVPMQLADGRVAKLTFEKGAPGERALAEASANW